MASQKTLKVAAIGLSVGHAGSIGPERPSFIHNWKQMEGVEVVYPEGSEIVKPGDPSTSIYVVTQGSARMVLEAPTSTGKMSSVLRLLGPGDLFGLGPALDGRPYVAGLQSMTETRVLVVSRESFLRELEDHPAACRGLLGQFGEMVRACESWIISLFT